MKLKLRLKWTTCGLFLLLLSSCVETTISDSCPIEHEWGLDTYLHEAFSNWDMGDFVQAHVLAWNAEEDDRPLYLEVCIAVIEREKGWILVKLYRNPKEEGENSKKWSPDMVLDAQQSPAQGYDKKPTKEDILAFIRSSWWHFEPEGGFRMVRSGVCEAALQDIFDMTPEELKKSSQAGSGN